MNELMISNQETFVETTVQNFTVSYTNTLTDETKRSYLSTIKSFFGVSDISDISINAIQSVTPEIATAWANEQVTNGIAQTTVNKKLSGLQSFYKFLCRRNIGIMGYNPFSTDEGCIRFKGAAKNYSSRIALTEDQIADIVSVIPQDGFESLQDELIGKRDYLIMAILITAGLRRSELCSIKIGDIQQVGDQYVVNVLGKGNKTRMMILAGSIWDKIVEYIELRGLSLEDNADLPLIVSHSTNGNGIDHLSDKTVERVVKKYAKLAGVDPSAVSPHVLRHTFCTELLRMGNDIVDVSDLMGHASISTTRRYDHINRTLENNSSNKLAERFNI